MMLGSQLEEEQRSERRHQQEHKWKPITGWRRCHVNEQPISVMDLQLVSTEEPSDGDQLPLTKPCRLISFCCQPTAKEVTSNLLFQKWFGQKQPIKTQHDVTLFQD